MGPYDIDPKKVVKVMELSAGQWYVFVPTIYEHNEGAIFIVDCLRCQAYNVNAIRRWQDNKLLFYETRWTVGPLNKREIDEINRKLESR